MAHRYVFLLGRPGCGKSALYRDLAARLLAGGQVKSTERLDDFTKLWARFQEDDARQRAGKARLWSKWLGDGRYRICGDTVFDEILKEVNAEARQRARPGHLVFVEFARSRNVAALQQFDPGILDRCLVIYVEVGFDLCWQRNVARFDAMAAAGDDHRVPRAEMEALYRHDDRDELVAYLRGRGIPVAVVNNEAEGQEHLRRQVEDLVRHWL